MEPSGPIRCSRSTAPVRTTRSRRSTRARRTPAPCTSARRGVATTPRSPLARVDTFTNQSAGIVDVDSGVGGARTITGTFTNKGHVNVNASGTYSGGTWTNSGTLAIATGTSLIGPVSGGVTFTNTTGGVIASTGTGLLQLDGGNTFNQGAGNDDRDRAGPPGWSRQWHDRRCRPALHRVRDVDHHGRRSGFSRWDDVDRPGPRRLGHLFQQRERGHRSAA